MTQTATATRATRAQLEQKIAELQQRLDEANTSLADLTASHGRLKEELKVMRHKVLTCGVAAEHPDANLTRTGAYADEWDSPQAEAVRVLRQRAVSAEAERDALRSELDAIKVCQWSACPVKRTTIRESR